jgi:NAD(P)-dependent dehydrogenase (short-subunit alcohol dehydrogenase family)
MEHRTTAARLEGRVAIVTGTARGIGRAIARAYAAEGAHVVGVDVLEDAGRAAAAEIVAEGGSARFEAADVSREADVRRVVAGVLEERGRIDVLVNNAAVQVEALATDVRVEDFHRIVDVNLLGCVLFCREVLPAMVAQRGGAIVNMSSVNAFAADPLLPVYGATKAAIIGYTKSVAIAYGPHGIRANAICPGDVDTELNQAFFRAHPDPAAFRARVEGQYPVRRIASPEEIARVAVFLASDDAAFVSGAEIVVDGAITSRIYEL